MGVTLIKSSDKFSKKRYAHKLYVVKSYAKRYHVRVWLKEVMRKSPMYYENYAKKYSLRSYWEKIIHKIMCINYKFSKLENYGWESRFPKKEMRTLVGNRALALLQAHAD